MLKDIFKLTIIFSTIFLIFFVFLIGGDPEAFETAVMNQAASAPAPEVLYNKDIDVVVTKVVKTWASNKENIWDVTVKSDEYGVEKTFKESTSLGYSTPYGNDLYYGQVKIGSILKCNMYSWKQGDVVTRRQLNNLTR